MFVCARDIVARTPDFDVLAQNMTLRPWQWEMLHAFDDRTSLGAIARRIGVDLASITESLSALEQHGLIKIRTVTREEYRRVFEMIAPSTTAPDVLDDDEDVVRPTAAKPTAPVEGAPQAKPVPPTGEPLSVRLEALRAKAEHAQSQRPPSADTVPFQAQAAPIVVDEPEPAALDTAEVATHTAAVELAQAPPEPAPDTSVFKSKLADLKARLDESLAKPADAPPSPADVPAPVTAAADTTMPPITMPRDAFADLSESLAAEEVELLDNAGVNDDVPIAVPIPTAADAEPAAATPGYVSSNGTANGNGVNHGPIAFSLSNDSAPKPALSPDAIEFSLGGNSGPSTTGAATADPDSPMPPPLKY